MDGVCMKPYNKIISLVGRICGASEKAHARKEWYLLNTLEKLNLNLHSLAVFRKLLSDEAVGRLSELLSCADRPLLERVDRYSAFAGALFRESENLTDYLLSRVLEDENIYVSKRAQNLPVGDALEECVISELKLIQEVSRLTAGEVKACLGYDGFLPAWKNAEADFVSAYFERLDHIETYGYGMFSKHHMFIVKDGALAPARLPDRVTLSDLKGYEAQRQAVIKNTLALLSGKPAANVLLYGDAGTGKSSTVKAITNEFKDRGLRLVEITRKQFGAIPAIAEDLSRNPLKFILFIDDLSFFKDSDDYNALKAILEGSVSAKAPNLVIYATSNRRHLVKESFSDRNGDDIHRNETIQELSSLSERFGLSVNFFKPDKGLYLEIVRELKNRYRVQMDGITLDAEAEKYALLRGGRSPRVARQFIEHLKSAEE